jgi:hypothetical protein
VTIEQGISRARRSVDLFRVFAVVLAMAAAALFWVPGLRACRGDFPVPLDDVFIHFDFARSLARGHPFEWIAGQGYSSGETSPLYMAILAIGWAIGFRGEWLACFAAGVTIASIASAMLSLRMLAKSTCGSIAGSILLVAIGALDFALFSGMEVALFVALTFHTFVLADRVVRSPPHLRASRQWRLGAIGACLVWTRPEAAVIVFCLAVLAARHARSQSPLVAMIRVALPGALATLAIGGLNFVMTGDFASAGARLKLLTSNPYLSDLDRARELVLNLVYFFLKVLQGSAVAKPSFVWIFLGCALGPLLVRRTREVSATILSSALLFTLLVSINGAARFQGFRYYAPAVAMIVLAVAMGIGVVARRSKWIGIALGVFLGISAGWRVRPSIRFFAQASENIHDQQRYVGEVVVHHFSGPVLLGDAGAIAYFSYSGAVDAMGLGGFHGMPFTRAALNGEASMLELIQRLPQKERPRSMALYPSWFPVTTSSFVNGKIAWPVTIEHNVICGGPTKLVAETDWAPLTDEGVPHAVDELDVADVESEDAHQYEGHGFTVASVVDGKFDGGRIIPAGESESFVTLVPAPDAYVVLRSDRAIDARIELLGGTPLEIRARETEGWIEAQVGPVSIPAGTRVTIVARQWLRDFHVWIVTR